MESSAFAVLGVARRLATRVTDLLSAIVLQLRRIDCLLMLVNHGPPIQPEPGLG
jgi:hypothetical protein